MTYRILVRFASTVPCRFVIKTDFKNQILVNVKQKVNISQHNIVYHADGGKFIMVNTLKIGTEKTFIKLHKVKPRAHN